VFSVAVIPIALAPSRDESRSRPEARVAGLFLVLMQSRARP